MHWIKKLIKYIKIMNSSRLEAKGIKDLNKFFAFMFVVRKSQRMGKV